MENYLTDRYQYTKIGEARSNLRKVDCGVPQGSSLGPLLFLLYENDLPLMSQFTTTLFADDTLLALSDDNLAKLECRVNAQLRHIDLWLKQNKLTLNHSKTTYLLFNKQPHVPVNSTFSFLINKNEITKSNSVKYLGVWFDDKLNWSAYIQDLSLQLAKCSNMLYHIRDLVSDNTLAMLYYSFVYSRITYGITAWGGITYGITAESFESTAYRNFLREVEVKQNNIIRTITWNKKFSHVNHLYKQLEILKLVDVYKLELAKFMHKLFNNKLPKLWQQNFTTIEQIHAYKTRRPNKSNFSNIEELNYGTILVKNCLLFSLLLVFQRHAKCSTTHMHLKEKRDKARGLKTYRYVSEKNKHKT